MPDASAKPVEHPYIAGQRLVFGGNVFGWTAGRDRSFALLDAFYEGGGRMVDTAEGYSSWVPGHKGGESELVLGEWLQSRGVRQEMRIATKTGMGGAPGSLARGKVETAFAASLDRLRTDYVDLYYVHRDDGSTPLEEVAGTYGALHASGAARELGLSNYEPERLTALLDTCDAMGVQPFTVLQNEYNLVTRHHYRPDMQQLCRARGIAVLPFYGLASGFLTGKYRAEQDWAGSARAYALKACAQADGWSVLAVMDEIVAETGATHAQVALAWLNCQPGIAAPLASATTTPQLTELLEATRLDLTNDQVARLTASQSSL